MPAGRLRDRVTFQANVGTTKDDHGQPVEDWRDQFTCWGELKGLSGNETTVANQPVGQDRYELTVRRANETASLTSAWRCVIRGLIYQIDCALPVDNRREFVKFAVILLPEHAGTGFALAWSDEEGDLISWSDSLGDVIAGG